MLLNGFVECHAFSIEIGINEILVTMELSSVVASDRFVPISCLIAGFVEGTSAIAKIEHAIIQRFVLEYRFVGRRLFSVLPP